MDAADKTRLEKLLGMLASSFDGERANAAAMIAAMAEKHRMTVVELINSAQPKPPPPPPRPTPPRQPAWSNYGSPSRRRGASPMIQALSEIADNVDLFDGVLTEWEIEFVGDVSQRYDREYELSDKQLVVVERILRKAQRHAGSV